MALPLPAFSAFVGIVSCARVERPRAECSACLVCDDLCSAFRSGIHGLPVLGNGVISAAAPRMAAQEAPDGEIKAFEGSMFAECLKGILGTCRSKPAAWRFQRRDADLVESDQKDKRSCSSLSDCDKHFIQQRSHFPSS